MNQAGVLPVPNIEYITNLKQLYKNLPSYQNGKVFFLYKYINIYMKI